MNGDKWQRFLPRSFRQDCWDSTKTKNAVMLLCYTDITYKLRCTFWIFSLSMNWSARQVTMVTWQFSHKPNSHMKEGYHRPPFGRWKCLVFTANAFSPAQWKQAFCGSNVYLIPKKLLLLSINLKIKNKFCTLTLLTTR